MWFQTVLLIYLLAAPELSNSDEDCSEYFSGTYESNSFAAEDLELPSLDLLEAHYHSNVTSFLNSSLEFNCV